VQGDLFAAPSPGTDTRRGDLAIVGASARSVVGGEL
jgi:hypothetical protein